MRVRLDARLWWVGARSRPVRRRDRTSAEPRSSRRSPRPWPPRPRSRRRPIASRAARSYRRRAAGLGAREPPGHSRRARLDVALTARPGSPPARGARGRRQPAARPPRRPRGAAGRRLRSAPGPATGPPRLAGRGTCPRPASRRPPGRPIRQRSPSAPRAGIAPERRRPVRSSLSSAAVALLGHCARKRTRGAVNPCNWPGCDNCLATSVISARR